jgi:hypothetical protein
VALKLTPMRVAGKDMDVIRLHVPAANGTNGSNVTLAQPSQNGTSAAATQPEPDPFAAWE